MTNLPTQSDRRPRYAWRYPLGVWLAWIAAMILGVVGGAQIVAWLERGAWPSLLPIDATIEVLAWSVPPALLLRRALGFRWWRCGAWVLATALGIELARRHNVTWARDTLDGIRWSRSWYEPLIAIYSGLLAGAPQAPLFLGRGAVAVGGWLLAGSLGFLLQQQLLSWLLGPITDIVTDHQRPLAWVAHLIVDKTGVSLFTVYLGASVSIVSAVTGLLVAWLAARDRREGFPFPQ